MNETWHIDAEATLQAVLDDAGSPALLRPTLTGAISWQVRNETPVQRALALLSVAPQWVAALLALGATVTVARDAGPAEMALEALLRQRKRDAVTALHVPKVARLRWGEAHVGRTPADDPIAAAVAGIEIADPATDSRSRGVVWRVRVALTGVWPEPVRLAEAPAQLVGHPLDRVSIRAVAEAVEKEVVPKGDFRGSQEYRRAMAGVLTRRALEQCLDQEVENE
jgi:CO/xanthine dehydrogenase FAD-binding subunit